MKTSPWNWLCEQFLWILNGKRTQKNVQVLFFNFCRKGLKMEHGVVKWTLLNLRVRRSRILIFLKVVVDIWDQPLKLYMVKTRAKSESIKIHARKKSKKNVTRTKRSRIVLYPNDIDQLARFPIFVVSCRCHQKTSRVVVHTGRHLIKNVRWNSNDKFS